MSRIDQAQYQKFLKEIKNQIDDARLAAAKNLNAGYVLLNFKLGGIIVEKQEENEWGDSVVEKLSKDLKKHVGGAEGFSAQNLWYMRQFYLEYRSNRKLLACAKKAPWGHNLLVMSKVKDAKARAYYLQATSSLGWSRNVLLNQIKAKAFERQLKGSKQHNFKSALPVHLAAQAEETLKSYYNLDFLGLNKPVLERRLENSMVEKIKRVILELGYGFCFIGNQHRLSLNKKEYFVDLLFFHRTLKCLVAIDLKIGEFMPEYAGKMNFYLNLLDANERMNGENASIGIILCADKDNVEVEFALKGIDKPIGVSQYQLTKKLPTKLKKELPGHLQLAELIKSEFKRRL